MFVEQPPLLHLPCQPPGLHDVIPYLAPVLSWHVGVCKLGRVCVSVQGGGGGGDGWWGHCWLWWWACSSSPALCQLGSKGFLLLLLPLLQLPHAQLLACPAGLPLCHGSLLLSFFQRLVLFSLHLLQA